MRRIPSKLLAVLVAVPLTACAADDGMRFQVISMERPGEGTGLPPPPDYTPCYSGEARAYDTNGDGHPDRIKVTVAGKDRCYGEDANHDGVIDTWDVMDEQGNLARRAHDSNGDGKVDQAWTFDPARKGCATMTVDRDGDGKADLGFPLDTCAPPPAVSPAVLGSRAAPGPTKP